MQSVLRVVAIGSGYTVLEAAPAIKRGAPHAHVTVINREIRHATLPSLAELLAGHVHLDDISVDLEQHYKKHNVEFIHGAVTKIDRKEKRVYIRDIEIPYDYLLIDAGSEPDLHSVPGIERAHTHISPIGMLSLRAHIVTEFLKFRASNDPRHRTFVVAGAGVRGIEIACALKQLMEQLCEQHLVFQHEIAIVLVEHDSNEYEFSPRVRKKIKSILQDEDIEYYAGKVTKFSQAGVELGDVTIESNTLVWCAKKHASPVARAIGVNTDDYGAAIVNAQFQTDDPLIFAAGDCASLPAAKYRTVPKTAFMAYDEEEIFAKNVIAAIHAKPLRTYKPRAALPVFITTSANTALLVTSLYTWHGKLPHKLKQWALARYARRVQNPA